MDRLREGRTGQTSEATIFFWPKFGGGVKTSNILVNGTSFILMKVCYLILMSSYLLHRSYGLSSQPRH